MEKYLESKIEGGIWACASVSARSVPALIAADEALLEGICSSGSFTLKKAQNMREAIPGDKK